MDSYVVSNQHYQMQYCKGEWTVHCLIPDYIPNMVRLTSVVSISCVHIVVQRLNTSGVIKFDGYSSLPPLELQQTSQWCGSLCIPTRRTSQLFHARWRVEWRPTSASQKGCTRCARVDYRCHTVRTVVIVTIMLVADELNQFDAWTVNCHRWYDNVEECWLRMNKR